MPEIDVPQVHTDPIQQGYINELRNQADTVKQRLAHAELRAAACILVRSFSHPDAQLLMVKDTADDGATSICPLVLLSADGRLLWFNTTDDMFGSDGYPGAEQLQPVPVLHWLTLSTVTDHLTDGYDAVGGCSGALSPTADDYFSAELNLLKLDLAAALNPYGPCPDHGFICKKCGGPSPIGVGYFADGTTAGLRSQSAKACPCGHSQTAGTMHDIPDPAR